MNKNIWLDLEETIITSWNAFLNFSGNTIKNEKKIRKFLKDNNVREVNIFSAAIWNDKDKGVFNKDIKPTLENVLNVKIIEFPSLEDLMKKEYTNRRIKWFNTSDFIETNCKFISFLNFLRFEQESNHHILIDDCVQNIRIEVEKHLIIETINITNL